MPDYSQYRLLPLHRRSPIDPRDFRHPVAAPSGDASLPARVRLCEQGLVGPIQDQGQEGSCAGWSVKQFLEHLRLAAGWGYQPLSAAFTYYEARALQGWQNQDLGSYLRDDFQVAVDLGICHETLMPYLAGQFALAPSAAALQEALAQKLGSYTALTDANEAVRLLGREQRAVAIATNFYPAWYQPQGGVWAPPSGSPAGGHAMLICGYESRPNPWNGNGVEVMLTAHNTWGLGFGDHGHVYLPLSWIGQAVYEYRCGALASPPAPQPATTVTAALADQAASVSLDLQVLRLQSGVLTPDQVQRLSQTFSQYVMLLQRAGLDPASFLSRK